MSTAQKHSVKPYSIIKDTKCPFGMLERSYSDSIYRFGFGGHEKDNEVKGEGNHLAFGDYGYDTRLGKRWRPDPLARKYPPFSPYHAFANSPIIVIDRNGRENVIVVGYDSDAAMWSAFMQKAIDESKKLSSLQPGEKTTIILYVGTLAEEDYKAMVKMATDAGVAIQPVKSKDELVNYINVRPKDESYEGGKDLISDFVYFGHGDEDYLYISNWMGTKESLDRTDFENGTIQKGAFTQTSACVFASCNSANNVDYIGEGTGNIAQSASQSVTKYTIGAKYFVNWNNGNFTWSSGTRTYENGTIIGDTNAENKYSTTGGEIQYYGREAPLRKIPMREIKEIPTND